MNVLNLFWRREPEARWEETQEMLRRLAELQRLAKAAGGRLTDVDDKQLLRQIRNERRAEPLRPKEPE